MGEHRVAVGAGQRHQGQAGLLGLADGQGRGGRNGHQHRHPRHGGLLHHLVRAAAGHQDEGLGRVQPVGQGRADQLVQGAVPAHVLAHQQDIAGRIGPRRGVHGAGRLAQRLAAFQGFQSALDRAAAHPQAIAGRAQGANGFGQLGHPAQAAARPAFQRALAGQGQGLFGRGPQHDVHRHALVTLFDSDVLDVGELGDRLGHGEAHGQVFDVLGGGHQHRVRAVVVREPYGCLVGRHPDDGLGPGHAHAPLLGLQFPGGREPAHLLALSVTPRR